jgi:regulator of replication initiation timing
MKELYDNKEKEELVNSIIEAMKEIEDLKDYVGKLNKINNHLVNQLSEELGFKEAARSEAEEVNRLQAENKKLREALEFYADSTNYSRKIDYKGLHYVSPIGEKFELGEDNGKKAREALKEVGKE